MDLTEGNLKSHIWAIATPACVGLFFNTMLNVIDTFFAGMISTEAIAALSLSFPLFILIIAFDQGISSGASTLISNAFGEKQKEQVRLYSAQTLSFGVISSFFVMLIGLTTSRFIFIQMGASGHLLDLSLEFMNTLFWGASAFVMGAAANAILLAHGNTKVLRNFLVVGCLINAILDPWLLFGGFGVPPLGVRGIAIATVIVELLGTLYIMGYVVKKHYLRGCKVSDFIPKWLYFSNLLKQSVPSSLNMMAIGIGFFVINFFLKEFSDQAVAAFGIGTRVQQIFLLPTIGLSIATLSIIGQNNGAKLPLRIYETILITLKWGALIASIGMVTMLFFGKALIGIFSRDPSVIEIGYLFLVSAAISNWGYMVMGIYNSTLQGLKHPNFPFYTTLVRQVLLPLILFPLLIHYYQFGIASLWISIVVISLTAAIVTRTYALHVLRKSYPLYY